MSKVEISVSNALKAYNKATKEGKELLSNLIGEILFNQKITDRITCMQDALDEAGPQDEEIQRILDYKGSNKRMLALRSLERLHIGISVLNEGKDPDYNNPSQTKYEPIFNLAGSGFSYSGYDDWAATSGAGSRLAYLDLEIMKHGVKIFLEDYKVYFKK